MSSREELLFCHALAQPEGARGTFLDQACGDDHALRARLDVLLAAHVRPEALDGPDAAVLPSSPGNEESGTLIGRYKLLQKIGEGGCGIVWMAEQSEPVRRRVALKVIKLGMDTKAVVARFEAERQALALMDHPNIAKVHDGGATESGRPFFVMELVRGYPITRFCDEGGLSPEERLRLFVQVCQAVQHAHQRGVIHRDLKPSNILVTMNDGATLPKVIDFGIAKATQGRLTEATLFTAFEQFIGTPAYMSPEQAEMSSVEIDERSDVYSLGVLLYELLTGRPPFDPKALAQAGVDEIRHQIRTAEPPRPSRKLQTLAEAERTSVARLRGTAPAQLSLLLRGDLDWIVMRCLEKDRKRRYASASALADDVLRHLRHEPVVARPPSAPYVVRKFLRRNRVGLGVATLCSFALIAGIGVARWTNPGPGPGRGGVFGPDSLPSSLRENAATAAKSVAVLTFTHQGGGPDIEILSRGVSEELVNVLGRIPELRVAAARSASMLKDTQLAVADIGRRLNVTHVLEGSVQRSEKDVRIYARLIHANTDQQVWGDHFDMPWENIFALQDNIARKIAEHLKIRLATAPRAIRTVNPEAHRLVIEGRHHWNLRNEDGFTRAETAFAKAVQVDPDFAEAHAGLAEVWMTRLNLRQFNGQIDADGDISRARTAARRALELDSSLAEGHAALGFVSRLEGRFGEAEDHFRRALELNPNSAVLYTWYALALACQGRLADALRAYDRASALEPFWFINLQRQAWHLTRARRFDDALQVNEQAESLHKEVHLPNRADQAIIWLALDRIPEAVQAARVVTQLPEREPRWQADSDAIWVLRRTGHEAEAVAHAERMLARWSRENFNRGFVLGALGRFDEALPFLEQTPATLVRGFYWDAMWDDWRRDPRFEQLLAKLGRLDDYRRARSSIDRISKLSAAGNLTPEGRPPSASRAK